MTVADKLFISALSKSNPNIISQVNKKWLDRAEIKKYVYIVDYMKESGELPGVRTFCDEFSLDKSAADSRPAYYLEKLKDRYVITELSEFLPEVLKRVDEDPNSLLQEIQEFVATLGRDDEKSTDVAYGENATERLREYLQKVDNGGVVDYSTGDEVLDKFFYGYRKKDLITIGGRAGSRKTFLLCFLALIASKVLPKNSGPILFVTNEISSTEISERMDCIENKLPWASFLEGKLSRGELKRYKEFLASLEKDRSKIIIVEDCYYLIDILTKIMVYKPAMVFIDGSYLLEPDEEEDWRKITKITRTLKRYAKKQDTPIINTTQMKRASGKGRKSSSFEAQDEFAFSNSYNQDSDLSFLIYQDKDMIYHHKFGLQVGKGRRVDPNKHLIFTCPLSTMNFGFEIDEDVFTDDDDSGGAITL
jgi:replicative DNA helicase